MNLLTHRRGSVALMTGIMAPVMVMVLAMGIEVTSWSMRRVELQRVADVSAWAGARQYVVSSNNAQSATGAAADLAEINGASGTAGRTWNPATLTTTDNLITAQVVSGVRNATDAAIKVTVKQNIAKLFSNIFPSTSSSVTVSAVAVAEFESVGAQPCILGLGGGPDGTTIGTDFTVNGNVSLTMTGCSVRADDGIVENGASASITAAGIYAGGTITGAGYGATPLYPNAGQIPDPYATNTLLQNDLNSLRPGTGTAISVKSNATQSITPGTYSGFNVKGTLNLSPGLYYVNGDITVGAGAVVSGTGVTIITSGIPTTTGNSSLTLTAPTTASPGGAIPGIAIAGTTSGTTLAFMGTSSLSVTGLIYFPKASLKFGGTPTSGGSGCTEVIAETITLVGTSSMAANCTAYGLIPFGSLPGTGGVVLVQ
jgi:Flp pilus assembly protein TadG